MTPNQIMEAATAGARQTLAAAEATVIHDLNRASATTWANQSISALWHGMDASQRERLVHAVTLQAFGMRPDDRYDDAIPRAIRAIARILTTMQRKAG